MKHSKGFTLIEFLVAVFVFSLVTGGALNLLLSSIKAQRQYLDSQRLFNQSSYVAEYMVRALRQAKKELTPTPNNCLTVVGRGYNYQVTAGQTTIRFLDKNNLCHEFTRIGVIIYEGISSNSTAAGFVGIPYFDLTPQDFLAQSLKFSLAGESQTDTIQPRVTISFTINDMEFQTTVSKRNFDVVQ